MEIKPAKLLDLLGNPLKIKFNSEKLNQPINESIKEVFKNDKIQCKDHDDLQHIEFKDGEIVCKTCGTKLKLVPSWLVP